MTNEARLNRDPEILEEHPYCAMNGGKKNDIGRFIAYPATYSLLAERLSATPDELAAWVFLEPEMGGLAAYMNANELDPPPRFYYSPDDGLDYLAALMSCWFAETEIAKFEPRDRFITGGELIARWNELPGIQTEAFIRAKIHESRLLDAHPIFGITRGSCPDDGSLPPLESGLFVLSHVEQIEAEDFGKDQLAKLEDRQTDSEAPEGKSKNLALPCNEPSMPGTVVCNPETVTDTKTHPLALFRSMNNLKFEEIKIRIDPEKLVLRISARGKQAAAPFSEIGITKKNEITLNSQGELFMAIANGTFSPEKKRSVRAVSRLSRSLREAFDTADSPFSTNKPHFQLSIPKNKAAEQRAIKRTVTYDDARKTRENTDAQEFFKANDPNYNPDIALYSDDPDLGAGD